MVSSGVDDAAVRTMATSHQVRVRSLRLGRGVHIGANLVSDYDRLLGRIQWNARPDQQRISCNRQRGIRAGRELRRPEYRAILARKCADATAQRGREDQII